MADDKPVLTRRRVLGGMATIGAAGAVGAGAWAGDSDTETVEATTNAGTLDIALTSVPQYSDIEGNPVTVNGSTLSFSVGEMAPGDVKTATVSLANTGSIDGSALGAEVTNVNSGEGVNPESETNTSGSGELDDQLDMAVTYDGGSTIIGTAPFSVDENSYNAGDFRDFNNVKQHGPYIANNVDYLDAGVSGRYLKIHLHYKDLDPSENNKSQGDSLTFDLEVTAYQNNQ